MTLILALLVVLIPQAVEAQTPVATPQEAVAGLLNRIGGNGAADKFEVVIDAGLAQDGKDVFVITSFNGKPCIKGNNQLAVATGINWYLNHYAHINLTWNNLTTDLSKVELPVPAGEEMHVCNTTYRYNFNTCTFSYSMAFWTWERWQQEIDWMALHGINAPLNLVGLDVVTRNFLRELGVSESDINAYIAGPGFIAWFAMNNLEGWGGTINAADVKMNGNPEWWYVRQEQLCRNMLQRMRELGMQPVIPGFSGQVPNCIVKYSIDGFRSSDVVNNGTWAGGYTRPDILKPNTASYRTFANVYYKHLHDVMGVSELYSIDPFHEGSLPGGVTNETCYPNIMVELDNYFNGVSQEDKAKNNVDEQPKWIIQYWQGVPQSGAFSAMSEYGNRFIGLDLFADNIYADNAAKWRTNYYNGRPYVYCMLHNFGGRSGLHGRLETTMNGYFEALAKGNNMQGVGATPEGIETNPILYDMLFELPWMDAKDRPTVDEWMADYAHARYGINNATALAALQNLKKSVWDCRVNQQGTSEAVILARPNWTVKSASSWSTSAIYWDTQDVRLAADQLSSIEELVTTADGKANYDYDFIDVVRQAMVDYAAELLPLINDARNAGDTAEYTRLYKLYLQLMLDLDEMLSYDANFKLERWTSLARNIADEVSGTTTNDRNWLEWNARTQITVWSKGNTDLHDYSNRCWAGLIKDFHYKRWEKFFTSNGGSFSGGWYDGFEYPWTVNYTDYDYSAVEIPDDMTATTKAKETFGNYFGRVKGAEKNYIFPMGVVTDATKVNVIPEVYRGQTVPLPVVIGKKVELTSAWVDLNADGAAGNGESLDVNDGKVVIPADATIGKTTAKLSYNDGTVITFNVAIIEDITVARTVSVASAGNGTVAIEGADALSVTNTNAVTLIATPATGYNFEKWTDAAGNAVSNDNPFIYYGKESASFTANFIQDKWGVVECNGQLSGDISSYGQFVHNLTFAYYNREPEAILETTTAPSAIFNTIPGIVDVPQGASFTVRYDNGNKDGLKYCYFRAFIDLNADGDFSDEGELLKSVGSAGAQNTAVCSNSVEVLLPYDMPLGITHMRLRFDGAWDNGSNPAGNDAKAASIRPVYEIVINVTDKSHKAANIKVQSNNAEWGTVEVWTDETPDGSTGTEWNVSANIPFHLRATKASPDVEFLGWYDHYGRLLSADLEYSRNAIEDAVYTARFRRCLVVDGWEFEYRIITGQQGGVALSRVSATGNPELTIPESVEILGQQYAVIGFDNNLFNGNKELCSIALPRTIKFLSVEDQPSSKERDPFEGCVNLEKIIVAAGCSSYYVNADGHLYNSKDVLVSVPVGVSRRGLADLIEKMEALTAQVATYNPVGKSNKIALQVTNPNAANYLWANSVETSEGNLSHLIDGVKGNNSNFFHSNWHTISTAEGYHFIEVDLGAESNITSMRFAYHTRTGCANDFPDAITVMGSNDKTEYANVYSVSAGLPQSAGTGYTSAVFSCAQPYRHLRFKVDAERVYWHMGEFELYRMTSTASVFKQYEGSSLNNSYAAAKYDVLLSAMSVFENGTTAAQMAKAKDELQKAYDELLAMVNAVTDIVDVVPSQSEGGKAIYNLAGSSLVQIDDPGVYVVNGKKVLVK